MFMGCFGFQRLFFGIGEMESASTLLAFDLGIILGRDDHLDISSA